LYQIYVKNLEVKTEAGNNMCEWHGTYLLSKFCC